MFKVYTSSFLCKQSRSTAITLGKVKNGEKKKWGNAPPNPDLLALHPVAISISSSVEQIPTPVNREQFTKRCGKFRGIC